MDFSPRLCPTYRFVLVNPTSTNMHVFLVVILASASNLYSYQKIEDYENFSELPLSLSSSSSSLDKINIEEDVDVPNLHIHLHSSKWAEGSGMVEDMVDESSGAASDPFLADVGDVLLPLESSSSLSSPSSLSHSLTSSSSSSSFSLLSSSSPPLSSSITLLSSSFLSSISSSLSSSTSLPLAASMLPMASSSSSSSPLLLTSETPSDSLNLSASTEHLVSLFTSSRQSTASGSLSSPSSPSLSSLSSPSSSYTTTARVSNNGLTFYNKEDFQNISLKTENFANSISTPAVELSPSASLEYSSHSLAYSSSLTYWSLPPDYVLNDNDINMQATDLEIQSDDEVVFWRTSSPSSSSSSPTPTLWRQPNRESIFHQSTHSLTSSQQLQPYYTNPLLLNSYFYQQHQQKQQRQLGTTLYWVFNCIGLLYFGILVTASCLAVKYHLDENNHHHDHDHHHQRLHHHHHQYYPPREEENIYEQISEPYADGGVLSTDELANGDVAVDCQQQQHEQQKTTEPQIQQHHEQNKQQFNVENQPNCQQQPQIQEQKNQENSQQLEHQRNESTENESSSPHQRRQQRNSFQEHNDTSRNNSPLPYFSGQVWIIIAGVSLNIMTAIALINGFHTRLQSQIPEESNAFVPLALFNHISLLTPLLLTGIQLKIFISSEISFQEHKTLRIKRKITIEWMFWIGATIYVVCVLLFALSIISTTSNQIAILNFSLAQISNVLGTCSLIPVAFALVSTMCNRRNVEATVIDFGSLYSLSSSYLRNRRWFVNAGAMLSACCIMASAITLVEFSLERWTGLLQSIDVSPLVVLPFRSMESLVVFLCCLAHTVHLWKVYNEHEALTYMRYVNLKGSDGYRYIVENKYGRVLSKTGDGSVYKSHKRRSDLEGKPMEGSFSSEATSAKESNFSSDNDLVMLVKERGYIRFKTENELRKNYRANLMKSKLCQNTQNSFRIESIKDRNSSEFQDENKNPPIVNDRTEPIIIENFTTQMSEIAQKKDLQFGEIAEQDEDKVREKIDSQLEQNRAFNSVGQPQTGRHPKTEIVMRKNIRFAPTSSTRDLKQFKTANVIDGGVADFQHESLQDGRLQRRSAMSLRSSLFGSQQLFRFRIPSIHLQDSIDEALNKFYLETS